MNKVKLPYGLRDGVMLYITFAERGAECGCVCPKCGGELIAHLGDDRAKHYKHRHKSDCEGATEHAIRAKLMELIERSGTFLLPASIAAIDGSEHTLIDEEAIEVGTVEVIEGGNPYLPAFRVRRKTADSSKEHEVTVVVNMGASEGGEFETGEACVEINLNDLGHDVSAERLMEVLRKSIHCTWINRPFAKEKEDELRKKLTFNRIKTTDEERNRLFQAAATHKKEFERISVGFTYGNEYEEKPRAFARIDASDNSEFARQFAGIEFTCDYCGESGLTHSQMQRFKPNYGTGTCYQCKGIKREKGLGFEGK
ncbi:MAG: hypothetical protein CML13_06790 [Puniceicoccaceae bacterium]|nr:hypothetical protein [Puniceicoccaceae bacterium]